MAIKHHEGEGQHRFFVILHLFQYTDHCNQREDDYYSRLGSEGEFYFLEAVGSMIAE